MSERVRPIMTPGVACPHGPALPAGTYCVDCQPGGRVVIETLRPPGELPPELRASPYDVRGPIAPPGDATVYIPGAHETPHIKKQRRLREGT